MRRPVRILACGSPDGGDDAAALAACRLLPRLLRSAVEEVGQLSAEQLMDDAPDVARVVVDCVRGVPPGRLIDLPLGQLADLRRPSPPGSGHALGPEAAVALAARLGGVRAADRFVGIGGDRFELGAPISPPVRAGLRRLAALVARRAARRAA